MTFSSPSRTRHSPSRTSTSSSKLNTPRTRSNRILPASHSVYKSDFDQSVKVPVAVVIPSSGSHRLSSRKRPIPITPSNMGVEEVESEGRPSHKKLKTSSSHLTRTRSSKNLKVEHGSGSEDEMALKPVKTIKRSKSILTTSDTESTVNRSSSINNRVKPDSQHHSPQPGPSNAALTTIRSSPNGTRDNLSANVDECEGTTAELGSTRARSPRLSQKDRQRITDDRPKERRSSGLLLSESCLSDVDARCLTAVDELLSGEVEEEDEEEEEEEKEPMAVQRSLSRSPTRISSPLQIASPTIRSTRVNEKQKNDFPKSVKTVTQVVPASTRAREKENRKTINVQEKEQEENSTSKDLPASNRVNEKIKTTNKVVSEKSRNSQKNKFTKEEALPALHKLLDHLSGNSPLPIRIEDLGANRQTILGSTECLVGLEKVEIELRMLLNRTIGEAEGNVLLLCGGRGSGKTAVVKRSLKLLSNPALYGDDGFITITLNGLVQINDRLALRELARQLLLALNANQSEVLGSSDEEFTEIGVGQFTTYANTLKHLLALLEPKASTSQTTGQVSKPLVIILEEFDRFAELDRQAFLYTLLDIVQGSKRTGGICVIGTTAVVDCLDRLEKRVKSRCQSRIQYVIGPQKKVDRIELVRSLLLLYPPLKVSEAEEQEKEESARAFREVWNVELEKFLGQKVVGDWLDRIFGLISEGVPKVLQDLNRLVAKIAQALEQTGELSVPILETLASDLKPRNISTQPWWASELGTLELSILISAKHLTTIHPNGLFNLEMCWDAYRKHIRRSAIKADQDQLDNRTLQHLNTRSQVYGRDAFEMGWERLCHAELILSTSANTLTRGVGLISRRFEFCKLVPFIGQVDKVIANRSELARHLKQWCKNWSD
ncbi:hypothetical protein CROQUDRAFT_136534 [Cronartium quercuum f. sp. fusiforme G11]|uniref:Origin recognition complex subunit 4 n=1 Tax=Cronartium quercuum f. sp. fusiforme G11 TaxID=708437 RepID=A0A9P6N6S4_9BASI|nr:hypothetical protein CROQUDRAFT_136534 [Cronartium quercuum f. sp. fusiforme G11]